MKLVDANIFIRYITGDDEQKALACYNLFQRIQNDQEEILLTESILTEVVYILWSRSLPYRLSRQDIQARLQPILSLDNLRLDNKRIFLYALDLFSVYQLLDFEDAILAARMEYLNITEVISYDQDFDRVPGLKRVEP
ncbi:MAG: type II toxin-antitoxin system VapC family toxin [SAR202 cluster bacterium]|nr:type II toxin-antitoxin system VapC family toxin [SAR202 cluster bacterium]